MHVYVDPSENKTLEFGQSGFIQQRRGSDPMQMGIVGGLNPSPLSFPEYLNFN